MLSRIGAYSDILIIVLQLFLVVSLIRSSCWLVTCLSSNGWEEMPGSGVVHKLPPLPYPDEVDDE